MKPLMVSGNSIAETWEKALLALHEEGVEIATMYDVDPNTGHKHPPSKDCSMVMHVENAVAEPRLHVCLQGGLDDLEEYRMEVVEGVKDHWVKRSPEEKYWTYTYHGRLARYGDRMNFAWSPEFANGTTSLTYFTGGYEQIYLEPFDQIQHIIDSIAETPYTRRAIAVTSFPPADAPTDDPPCLRECWCRGYYRDGVLKIDMQTYWRSRDAWGAALYNMYGLTELQRYIATKIQDKLDEQHAELLTKPCPKCGSEVKDVWGISLGKDISGTPAPTGDSSAYIYCKACDLNPYLVVAGSYTDFSSSFHIYGKDLPTFEDQMLSAVKNRTPEQRMWNVGDMLSGNERTRIRDAVMEKIARRDAEREVK